MHLNRQIILLFFLSSIVNLSSRYRQAIVKQSSIVNRQAKGSKVNRPKGQPAQRSSGPKVKPGPTIGTTTGAGAKGIYIWNATAPQKINKKNLWVKVAMGRARRIFELTKQP
jgi:hypothetical protein